MFGRHYCWFFFLSRRWTRFVVVLLCGAERCPAQALFPHSADVVCRWWKLGRWSGKLLMSFLFSIAPNRFVVVACDVWCCSVFASSQILFVAGGCGAVCVVVVHSFFCFRTHVLPTGFGRHHRKILWVSRSIWQLAALRPREVWRRSLFVGPSRQRSVLIGRSACVFEKKCDANFAGGGEERSRCVSPETRKKSVKK